MTDAEWLKKQSNGYDFDDEDSNRLRAIAARLEADEWQPIETAPSNGKYLCSACGTHWKPLPKRPQ